MRYLIILLLLSSCYTKKQAVKRFCQQDSVTVHDTIIVRDTILIPVDSNEFSLNIDSLTQTLREIYSDNIFIIKAQKRDKEIQIKYITKEKVIPFEKKVSYIKTVPCNCPEVCPQTEWQKAKAARVSILIAFAVGLLLGVYMKFRR